MEQLESYASHLNASPDVFEWLKTAGAKALKTEKISVSELEHILDFLVSSAAPARLRKMSLSDAKRKATEWTKQQQKKGRDLVDTEDDIESIHDFKDGTKIVRLKSKKALQREGFLMGHCVGGYSVDNSDQHIYSYRDLKNMPHATFEVKRKDKEILQIKGKGNGPIHPKYIHPILVFLENIGMKIRPSDMSNLGYHHIHKEHIEFLNKYENARKQIAEINGETYAF